MSWKLSDKQLFVYVLQKSVILQPTAHPVCLTVLNAAAVKPGTFEEFWVQVVYGGKYQCASFLDGFQCMDV